MKTLAQLNAQYRAHYSNFQRPTVDATEPELTKQQRLDQIDEMIESSKRDLKNDRVGNREAIRARIKRLNALYQEIRNEGRDT